MNLRTAQEKLHHSAFKSSSSVDGWERLPSNARVCVRNSRRTSMARTAALIAAAVLCWGQAACKTTFPTFGTSHTDRNSIESSSNEDTPIGDNLQSSWIRSSNSEVYPAFTTSPTIRSYKSSPNPIERRQTKILIESSLIPIGRSKNKEFTFGKSQNSRYNQETSTGSKRHKKTSFRSGDNETPYRSNNHRATSIGSLSSLIRNISNEETSFRNNNHLAYSIPSAIRSKRNNYQETSSGSKTIAIRSKRDERSTFGSNNDQATLIRSQLTSSGSPITIGSSQISFGSPPISIGSSPTFGGSRSNDRTPLGGNSQQKSSLGRGNSEGYTVFYRSDDVFVNLNKDVVHRTYPNLQQSSETHRTGDHSSNGVGVVNGVVNRVNASDAESLRRRLEMSTEFFLVPSSTSTHQPPIITKSSPCIGCRPDRKPPLEEVSAVPRPTLFRNEVWVVPVLALASICMLLIVGFEVFVLCKAWRTTPSRRHLFLGQMLLLGLFACAGLGGILALAPTPATCAAIRFGAGVAYAVVFASLLVKCVFLISLNGGVYLPAPYQGLLLLFAVLIQVAIGGQWLLTNPPLVDVVHIEDTSLTAPPGRHRLLVTVEDVNASTITLCRTPFIDVLFSLCYVLFLIVFVAVLAVKSRGIRDNYREATYIGLSVGCTIPIWLVWTLSGLVISERHRDACLAFGLVITATVVFLVMFMPKGRQLAAMGKDGVFLEDREDRFSSLSRAGSGYSPSFFHFKPVKYGGGSGKQMPAPATITTLGADRVALYPAPPSYSRMFHYYPSPQCYYPARYLPGGVFIRPDDGNVYTTLEPTLSSNPNVYFQRGNAMHPGMMY